MKTWKFFAVVPLMVAGVWAATPAGNEIVVPERVLPGLDQILRGAVQQSPRMVNRALDLQIAADDRIQARAGLLPTIGGSARYNQSRDDRADVAGTLNVRKTYYDFSLNQPVFFWGERRNTARMGEMREKIAQGQYREGFHLLAQELRAQYLQLMVRKASLARSRFYQQFAKNQLILGEDRLAKKVISDAEIFSLRINSERADLDFERNAFEFEGAKTTFSRLAGIPPIANDAIADSIPTLTYEAPVLDRMLAGFLSQKEFPSTEAFAMRHQIEIGNLDYLNQKTRLRPKFSFSIGANQDEQAYNLNTAQKFRVNSKYAGIAVNWAIFDGFAAQAGARIALARRRQLENDYRELTERLAQQAQAQAKQIYFSARNMSISDRFLDSGEGNFRSKQDENKRGLVSETDVSLARLSLHDAQINALNSRADYLLKIGDFLGTLTEDPVLANLAAK